MKSKLDSLAQATALPPFWGRRRDLLLAGGCLLIATLVCFAKVLLLDGGATVLSQQSLDLALQFIAWRQFGFSELAKGHLVLWNPYIYCGTPFFGGFQPALLYPPNWLYMVLPLGWAVNVGIALHVFLAGLWTWCWAARRGLGFAASMVAALVFMFGGAHLMHVWAGHLPNLCTMIWAPLIFLCIDDLTLTQSLRAAWIGAAALAMQILAGHPQYVFYTAVGAGIYTLLVLPASPARARSLLALVLMGAGAAALAAVQLLAGLAAVRESLRGDVSYDFAGTFALAPENLLTVVLPRLFGDGLSVKYWGRWLLWEQSQYIGVTSLALASYGAVRGSKSVRRFSITMVVLSFLVALGFYTPLFRLLFLLPGFSSFRGIGKFSFIALLFLAMLAGIGFDSLMKQPGRSRRVPVILAGGGAAMLVLAVAVHDSASGDGVGAWPLFRQLFDFSDIGYFSITPAQMTADFVRASALLASRDLFTCAAACAVVAGVWWAAGWRKEAALVLPVLLAAELYIFAWRIPTFPLAALDAGGSPDAAVDAVLKQMPPDDRIYSFRQGIIVRDRALDIWGDDPMLLRRYAEFLAYDQHLSPSELINATLRQPSWMWRLLRLRVAINWLPAFDVHRLDWDLPRRAELIEQWQFVEDRRQILGMLSNPKFDFHQSVLLEEPFVPGASMPAGAPAIKKIQWKDLSTDAMEFEVDAPRPAILLISDNYSDGWKALSLDHSTQDSYRVIPADYTLRGIPLSAGHHHFRLEYRPLEFVVGKWISGVALLGWIALPGFRIWSDRKASRESRMPGNAAEKTVTRLGRR